MRRFVPALALALALPLAAAVPASRVKEPNAVFVYGMPETGRIQATLFDRAKRKALDHLDARTDLPFADGDADSNDAVQFSPATGKIYALVDNVRARDGGRVDPDLPYDVAIVETGFDFTEPDVVFSCDGCRTGQWIVHPTKPVLYVSLPDPYGDGGDEFLNAKLVEVTLAPRLRTRVITRIPPDAALRITPDGRKLFAFGLAEHSRAPYGALVTVDLANRRRVQSVVNFPARNAFDLPAAPATADAAPDALEMAYHLGIVDVRTGDRDVLYPESDYALDDPSIGWSRDASRLLFQLMRKDPDPGEGTEVPLLYDRNGGKEWILPLQDAEFLDWAPAQTAILFRKHGDVGFYDLSAREWVFVARGTDGAWATLPTKRVPKR
jgi:hypothetical protein